MAGERGLVSQAGADGEISRAVHARGPHRPPKVTGQAQHPTNNALTTEPWRDPDGTTPTGNQRSNVHDPGLRATASFSRELQTNYVLCPHHGLFHYAASASRSQRDSTPIERFLGEGPATQSAFFVRPDTGRLSTMRECGCRARIEAASPEQGGRR